MKNKWLIKKLFGVVFSPAPMFFIAVLIFVFPLPGFAKMSEKPKSFSLEDRSLEQVQLKVLPKVNTEPFLAEDLAREKKQMHVGPYPFAVAINVAFNLENSSTWQTLADGRLWRLRIQSPGAKSLNLGITRFDLPRGAKLWIYNPERKHVEGPYTSQDRSRSGSLWTPIIEGDLIVVEVFIPAGLPQPVIEIGKVNHGYRGLGTAGVFSNSNSCERDVICPEGNPWRDQISAVAKYTFQPIEEGDLARVPEEIKEIILKQYVCTGTLLNNLECPRKPYFLSASHCFDQCKDKAKCAETVVVYWNYESATCSTRGPGPLNYNQSGAIFVANSVKSDFLLLELQKRPDPSYNVFYAGWDAGDLQPLPSATVGIHHPKGDVKAINISPSQLKITSYTPGEDPNETEDPTSLEKYYWRVVWGSGMTEKGSSGSCLFDANTKRCIGQHRGGWSCCDPQNSMHDYYGMLSVSWEGDGTPQTSLKGHLDPQNTDIRFLNGNRPGILERFRWRLCNLRTRLFPPFKPKRKISSP